MTLSTLTWNLVGPIIIGSSSDPGRKRDKQEVMAAFNTLINSSSYWSVETFDVTGSWLEAMVLAPTASSAVADMRVILTANATGSATFWAPRANGTAEVDTALQVQAGLCPDITENGGGTYTAGHFLSDDPFGTSVRWSGYWSAGDPMNVTTVELAYLIESDECLWIGMCGRRTPQHGMLIGPIGVAFEDSSGEADRRVFGMLCTGDIAIATTFLGNLSYFSSHSATSGQSHVGFFRVSGSVPAGPSKNRENVWDCVQRVAVYGPAGQSSSDRGYTTTAGENLIGLPIAYVRTTSPTRIVALGRQFYVVQDFPALQTLVTGTNGFTTVGYTLGNDSLTTNDALLLGNV